MRIISGKFKGRRINPPRNLPVRPTTDMAKEALFNILNNLFYFDELSVLDLFSGTGSISFEFASRGVENITSVDSNHGCCKFIQQTAGEFGMSIEVVKADVFKFLTSQNVPFDIIFADPPYEFSVEDYAILIGLVFENKLLSDKGVLIIEHEKQKELSQLNNFSESRNYGGCVFSFFE